MVLMMLRRLSRQKHDYNLKLTKAELMALYRIETYQDEPGDIAHWVEIGALIRKEVARLGNAQGEQGQEESGDRS